MSWKNGFKANVYAKVFLYLYLYLVNNAAVLSSDISQSGSTSAFPSKLQHEPIQPLSQELGLSPEKVKLGEKLFNDNRFGRDNDMSCASCHILRLNGANHHRYTIGRNGVELDVNSLTVFNSSLNHPQFWDGRAADLHQQIDFVMASKKEFSNSWPVIIERLRLDKNYIERFSKLYNDGVTKKNVRDAITVFERSLITINSRFDRFLLGDSKAISINEKKGYGLFKAYGCVACHQGSNVGGNLFMKFGIFGDYFSARGNLTKADLGRFNVTGNEADRYVFRVPSLRLAAITAPYFHDGSVKTLKKAVEIMAKHQLGRVIPKKDVSAIVSFLKTLPGDYNGQPLMNSELSAEKGESP